MSQAASLQAGRSTVSPDIVFPVEAVEARIFYLKRRVADMAYRSSRVEVVRAASGLLVSLTELLEDLKEGENPVLVLARLQVVESDVVSLLRDPESFASEHGSP